MTCSNVAVTKLMSPFRSMSGSIRQVTSSRFCSWATELVNFGDQ